MKPRATIFYIWQDSLKAAACKNLILEAAREATAQLVDEADLDVEPTIDRDTLGESGSPSIADLILSKIEGATVALADVSLCPHGFPNANVLFEVGYAAKVLGFERTILVQNDAFGGPEKLPFDLRHRRILRFTSGAEAEVRAPARRDLSAALREAFRGALKLTPPAPPVAKIEVLKSIVEQLADQHIYRLAIHLRNLSSADIREWAVEAELPRVVFKQPLDTRYVVEARSSRTRLFFRLTSVLRGEPIHPGDSAYFTIQYTMTHDLYRRREEFFNEPVTVRAFVDGQAVGESSTPFREYQNF